MKIQETVDDKESYWVVINDEGQYSIWPSDSAIPAGWKSVGKNGMKTECLTYIKQVWTDMRPLSLIEKMREAT
ncbi:MAG: MbtH domain protein [Rhodocyclales bacterium]|nr:MbtH domain protein [Rhodocyclales bacterium]